MLDSGSNHLFAEVELADFLKGQPAMEPLVLHTDPMKLTFSATRLSVQGESDYGRGRGAPVLKDGHVHCAVMRFTGNPLLWKARPEGMGTGLLPRGSVDTDESHLTLSFAHTDAVTSNWYPRERQKMLDRIQVFINYQADPLARHNAALASKT